MIGTSVLQRKPIIIQRWADESTANSIPRKDAAFILRANRKQLGRARVVRTRLNASRYTEVMRPHCAEPESWRQHPSFAAARSRASWHQVHHRSCDPGSHPVMQSGESLD